MTSPEPLKSALSLGNVDDTSLALPSGTRSRSGEQRVLEQVQTIRRSRSRQSCSSSRSTSTSLTPTSPVFDSVFVDPLKPQSPSNGAVSYGNGFSKTHNTLEKNMKWQVVNNSKLSTVSRNPTTSIYQYEKSYSMGSAPLARTNTSRSEPDYARPRPASMHTDSVTLHRFYSSQATNRGEMSPGAFRPVPTRTDHLSQSQTTTGFRSGQTEASRTLQKHLVVEDAARSRGDPGSPGNNGVADITMKEAVELLSTSDEAFQHCGASYIQHSTFIDDKAKEELLRLGGVPPLVALLRSPSPQVNQTASAALRNLSFRSHGNKEAIHACGGIAEAVTLLRNTDSADTQKQLTGLLWNLSSADHLKPDLLKSALPVLMECVVLPHTTGPDRTGGHGLDPEVFYHATGCLRNLSSSTQNNRQVMRKCRGLVDSLVSYVKECVEAGKPDDKSVENCVCILHNLTFQLEAEAPALFSRITGATKHLTRSDSQGDVGPMGCFSPPSKSSEPQQSFDATVLEERQPDDAGWLLHSQTMQSYLDLLGSSQREETQEACCGALQNLITHDSPVSKVLSQILVQKLNGLQVLTPLIKSQKVNLQKNAVSLVGNLTKNPILHNSIARKALPQLLDVINAGTKEGNESDDTLSMACQAATCLLMKEPEMGKRLLNGQLIHSLTQLSQNNYFPKSSKAASLLLYNLWSDKDLQSFLKKQGMSKSSFVNDITTSALRSVQIVD